MMRPRDIEKIPAVGRRRFLEQATLAAAGTAIAAAGIPGCAARRTARTTGVRPEITLRHNINPPQVEPSRVSLIAGSDRRASVYKALKPFQSEVEKAIGDKQVVVKVNAGLATPRYEIFSSHPDEIRGVLDFLTEFYDRRIIISEGVASNLMSAFIGYENYGYMPLESEYNCKLIDANDMPYTLKWIHAAMSYPMPINIIDLYMDPDVYIVSAARMKTHDAVVGTYSLKNVSMGAPVAHYKDKYKGIKWQNEKFKMHGGPTYRGGEELSFNMFSLALMGVYPDLAVIDGVQAIEGNGPWNGTPVDHNVVVASTDFVAADRLCSTLMGIDPNWMKYLEWCEAAGLGNFAMDRFTIEGADYRDHVKKYALNKNIDWQVSWIRDIFGE